MAGRHEQPVSLHAAERNVGTALRQRDKPDRLSARIEHLHAFLLRIAHPPATPKISVDIDTEAFGRAARLDGDERALVGELGAVIGDIEHLDDTRIERGLDYIELRLVR